MFKKKKGHVDDHWALLRVPQDVRQLIEEDPDIPVRVIRELGSVGEEADLDADTGGSGTKVAKGPGATEKNA